MFRDVPVFPFLVAAFPVVSLWSANLREVPASMVVAPLSVVLASTAVAMLIFSLACGNALAGARVTALLAALFFVYGYARDAMGGSSWSSVVLAVAWLSAVLVATYVGRATRDRWRRSTSFLNTFGVLLIGVTVTQIAVAGEIVWTFETTAHATEAGPTSTTSDSPDVWYLVFDRYAGEPTLSQLYGIDNSDFYDALEAHGFTIVEGSTANYQNTMYSLTSALNMQYVQDLASEGAPDGVVPVTFSKMRDHELGRRLTSSGYRYEHVGNWWEPTRSADRAHAVHTYSDLSEFARTLVDRTPLPVLAAAVRGDSADADGVARRTVEFQLEALRRIAGADTHAPRFVFGHLTVPHPPYIFDADGAPTTPRAVESRSRVDNYGRQLSFVNRSILELLDLIDGSGRSSIVVLQADEGPYPADDSDGVFQWRDATPAEFTEKFRILTAVTVAGTAPDWGSTTPVNTFRELLREEFGHEDLAQLPERSYVFESLDEPFEFTDVTDRIGGTDSS